jgi:tyrosyl-tRNA synthetase
MSKTWGNAIWLDDQPNDMYRKVMAIVDDLIINYFILGTDLPLDKIGEYEKKLKDGENPINIKKELAHQVVTELYDISAANEAQKEFEKTVQNKELPEKVDLFPVGDFDQTIFDIASDWAKISNSELKRLIQQKGVEVDGVKIDIDGANKKITNGMVIKIGQRRIVKISSK